MFKSFLIVLLFGCGINFCWWGGDCLRFWGLIRCGKLVFGVNENDFLSGGRFLILRVLKFGVGMLIFLMLMRGNVVLVLFNFVRVFFFNKDGIWVW